MPYNQKFKVISGLILSMLLAGFFFKPATVAARKSVRLPSNENTIAGSVEGLASQGLISAISAGTYHTCAVTNSGGLKCWGRNEYGQLGDGSTTERDTPVDVVGLSSGVMAVSAGNEHTCALLIGGAVKCWGRKNHGQLGDMTNEERHTPVNVYNLSSGIMKISIGQSHMVGGESHTCALTSGGAVKCWGYNGSGELGDGTIIDRIYPVNVINLSSGVMDISAGSDYTCAVTTSGAAKCWGLNADGKLGDGTYDARSTPTDVDGLSNGVAAITTGENHTCALISGGAFKCWGNNWPGKLGNGLMDGSPSPVDVYGISSGGTAISAGGTHTCGLISGGAAKCWGDNWYGQLGVGTNTSYYVTPADVAGLFSGVLAISAGYEHTCALLSGGNVKCWGWNYYGQLGDGTTENRYPPVDVYFSSYALNVTKGGAGSGTVTSSPAGINCGSDCAETYVSGSFITLTASPDPGSIFTGWAGAGCYGTGACSLTMNAAKSVTAYFSPPGISPYKVFLPYIKK